MSAEHEFIEIPCIGRAHTASRTTAGRGAERACRDFENRRTAGGQGGGGRDSGCDFGSVCESGREGSGISLKLRGLSGLSGKAGGELGTAGLKTVQQRVEFGELLRCFFGFRMLPVPVSLSSLHSSVERELLLASGPKLGNLEFEDRESCGNRGARRGLGWEANGSEHVVGLEEGGVLGHKSIKPGFWVVGGWRGRGGGGRRRTASIKRRRGAVRSSPRGEEASTTHDG
jgi:hypothetical protein